MDPSAERLHSRSQNEARHWADRLARTSARTADGSHFKHGAAFAIFFEMAPAAQAKVKCAARADQYRAICGSDFEAVRFSVTSTSLIDRKKFRMTQEMKSGAAPFMSTTKIKSWRRRGAARLPRVTLTNAAFSLRCAPSLAERYEDRIWSRVAPFRPGATKIWRDPSD